MIVSWVHQIKLSITEISFTYFFLLFLNVAVRKCYRTVGVAWVIVSKYGCLACRFPCG